MSDLLPPQPFRIKDCALTAIATGEKAASLEEFRDRLTSIHLGCIYYHFWGARLHSRFANPDYLNDFANWAHKGLHDDILAERLNILDPMEYEDLEKLRQDLLDIVEERLDEREFQFPATKDNRFYFIRSNTIVFDTSTTVSSPQEFKNILPQVSINSIFYHFVEARRRQPESVDDFSCWLKGFNNKYEYLLKSLKEIDPYFITMQELKQKLIEIFAVSIEPIKY